VFPSAAAVLSPPTIGFANDLTPLDAATAGSAARASHFPAFSNDARHVAQLLSEIQNFIQTSAGQFEIINQQQEILSGL
ncbi:MAG: hypothetical protein WBE18_05765, partial [Gammaproteobacteria bacterium]